MKAYVAGFRGGGKDEKEAGVGKGGSNVGCIIKTMKIEKLFLAAVLNSLAGFTNKIHKNKD